MIDYQFFALSNGLKVYVHEDESTPLAAVNIAYNIGSRDEDENKTGFAHLFEHLMFGGSKNIQSYDEPLQRVGGENNAFTSPDITNYYVTLPAENIETAFWLESDRMLGLSFDPKVLEVQRKVVIEEFKQRYLNQPYGDAWLQLRPLAYQAHPYKWATIGKEISHIANATMEEVKAFFYKFYVPNNAVMVVAGNIKTKAVKVLAEKWFGPIPSGQAYHRQLPQEPQQLEKRTKTVYADVPLDAIYKVYHMPGKYTKPYHIADLLSDVIGRGKSSRLYERLIKREQLFNSLNAYVSGSLDPGLLVINGKLNADISPEEGEEAIERVLKEVREESICEEELKKVKNQAEASLVFSEVDLLHRTMNLAFAALHGDPDYVNKEPEIIQQVTALELQAMAENILVPENCSTLFYMKKRE